MDSLKNLAGGDVSIFLFRFDVHSNAIDFVINEAIAADMYPEVDEQLKPLAHACCETLLRYKHLSVSTTIMDGNLLDTGEFEVMLSRGVGSYFPDAEEHQLQPLVCQHGTVLADQLSVVPEERRLTSFAARPLADPWNPPVKDSRLVAPPRLVRPGFAASA